MSHIHTKCFVYRCLRRSWHSMLTILNTPFCVWVWVCFWKESKTHSHSYTIRNERETHTKLKKKHTRTHSIRTKDLQIYVNVWDNYSHTRALLRSFPLSPSFVLLFWILFVVFALTLWTNWWPYCGWERENRTKVKIKISHTHTHTHTIYSCV